MGYGCVQPRITFTRPSRILHGRENGERLAENGERFWKNGERIWAEQARAGVMLVRAGAMKA